MKYTTESEIEELVRTFEDATVSRDDWKHAEHLIVALHYLSKHNIEMATEKMRSGIFKLLTEGFGVDLSKDMPYHETLTVFWMRTVADFNTSKNGDSLPDKARELVERYDKDYPLRFYSRDFLFSDAARSAISRERSGKLGAYLDSYLRCVAANRGVTDAVRTLGLHNSATTPFPF